MQKRLIIVAVLLLVTAVFVFSEICTVEVVWGGKKKYSAVFDYGSGRTEILEYNPFSMVDFLNMMEQKGWKLDRVLFTSDSKWMFLFRK